MTAFPGADAARDGAGYVLVGAPLDATTTFRPGTRSGPGRVRRFAAPFDDYDRRTDAAFSALGVHDAGDVATWDPAEEYLDHLTAELRAAVIDDAVPLLLGGEHTVAWAGVRATDPDTLVVLDAHLDLRDRHRGSPLNHACVTRRALDGPADRDIGDGSDGSAEGGDTGANGEGMEDDGGANGKGMGADDRESTDAAHPTADAAVVVGARTGSRAEWERADAADVTVVPPAEVGGWLDGLDPGALGDVYLSVDVDAADPAVAPGTGTMEPFGLAARDLRAVVRTLAPRAVGCDVVEVNDRDDGQAAALGAKLLREFVYAHADANGR
ncbi:MAG: arginase family protein [Haloferacaceae archaeon]